MNIIDLSTDHKTAVQEAALLLVDGFADTGSTAWPNLEAALQEVQEALQPGRICCIALGDAGEVAGWIGARTDGGPLWELHPLVVARHCRGQGIGRALVEDLEQQVVLRGGFTIMLGTDDENGRTSLGGTDLYPGVLDKLKTIANLHRHPFAFYLKMGFEIVGVIPDANGYGKPDIVMAKRVGPDPTRRAVTWPNPKT